MRNSIIAIIVVLLVSFFAPACSAEQEILLTGRTMGTTYHIKAVVGRFFDGAGLQAKIENQLEAINQSMSTFRPTSEISRFNATDRTGAPFPVSEDFLAVMRVARNLYDLTQGAWDGTVKPLVDLWGFGKNAAPRVPTPDEITRALSRVGFAHIAITDSGSLIKYQAGVTLDLASIAKGYGVDRIARVIRAAGVNDFLVEIGGEVFASGLRRDGAKWKIGINKPLADAAYNAVYRVLPLHDQALATSGDYRNFFEANGRRYSHVMDPRTGYPVSNGVVSVSIVAPNCTLADGLATAVMVMGPDRGLALIDALDRVEGLIIVLADDGTLHDRSSSGFAFETLQ